MCPQAHIISGAASLPKAASFARQGKHHLKKHAAACFFLSSEYEKDRYPFLIDGFELTKKQAKYLDYARCDIIC